MQILVDVHDIKQDSYEGPDAVRSTIDTFFEKRYAPLSKQYGDVSVMTAIYGGRGFGWMTR